MKKETCTIVQGRADDYFEEELLVFQRIDENKVSIHSTPQAFQGGQSCQAVLTCSGKSLLKGVVAGDDRSGSRNLLIALLDEFNEDSRTGAQARFDFVQSVSSIGLTNDQIGRALQKGQEGNEKKKQTASKPPELKFQGYPPVPKSGARRARKSGLNSMLKAMALLELPERSII